MSRIKCEILEATPQKVKFILNNCDVSLANALRRILIAQVPTMAPNLISVFQNTSVLHDQFLAQRIGLIPFYSQQVDSYQYPWNCKCTSQNIDQCTTCKLQFRLHVKNDQDRIKQVTSMDIQCVQMRQQSGQNSRAVSPVQYFSNLQDGKQVGIPIVKLNKNQQINLKFDVQKGIGKMHAKWTPVSLATFQPDPQIKINHQIQATLQQKIAIKQSCPAKVFEVQNGNLQPINVQKCIFCGQCQKKAQLLSMQRLKNYIQVGKVKDRFIFSVQSVGSMPAAVIVKKAMKVLREKLQSIQRIINNNDRD